MKKPSIRILMLEDNVADVYLVRELISVQSILDVSLKFVRTLREGLEYLRSRPVDVILLDFHLPDSHGLDTFLRIQAETESTPIINFVEQKDATLGLLAVKRGAQDYLIKTRMDGEIFARAILCAIEREKLKQKIQLEQIFEEVKTALL